MQKHTLSILYICLMALLTDCNYRPSSDTQTVPPKKVKPTPQQEPTLEKLIEQIKAPSIDIFEPMWQEYGDSNILALKQVLKEVIVQGEAIDEKFVGFDTYLGPTQFPVLLAAILFHVDPKILQALIDKGANPNTQYGIKSWPILYEATQRGNFEGIKFLVDKGAQVKETEEKISRVGEGKLLGALFENKNVSKNQKEELVKIFINKGLDINAPIDYENKTLLHRYCSEEIDENCEILLSIDGIKKSILQASDLDDLTPWELALKQGNTTLATQMIRLITAEDAQAKLNRGSQAKLMPKSFDFPVWDKQKISQIDRLRKYEHSDWKQIKQAFLDIGITEQQISEGHAHWDGNIRLIGLK